MQQQPGPQYGFTNTPPGYPGPQYGYQQPPQRSAIPKVIGILMIIFGSLGILGGLIGLAGSGLGGGFGEIPELKTINTIQKLESVVGLALSILQLYAGIRLIGYKSNALGMAKAYAIARMAFEIVSAILVYAWMKPIMDTAMKGSGMDIGGLMGGFVVIGMIIGLAWPIVVLALVTRPAAKAACVNEL
jgi:hypothetical protein